MKLRILPFILYLYFNSCMMKKFTLLFLFLFVLQAGFSQSKLWKGYFSYREIKDLSESPSKIVAASENALFSKELITGAVKTINTVDGLSGQPISAIYHSAAFKKTLVGYQNGLIIVINEIDGSMLNVVDIINKTLPPNLKKVNHFMEYNGIAYVSCDFGIVQYNLRTLQFGDTYFIGNVGAQIVVTQTTIFNNTIYAATRDFGIRAADINNPNLNDYNQWTTLDTNGWLGVEAFGTEMLAVTTSGGLQRFQGANFTPFQTFPETAADFRHSGNYLILATANHIYIYNSSLVQVRHITSNEIDLDGLRFTCATVVNNRIYIGTAADGIFSTTLAPSVYEDMTPSGPIKNDIFAITATSANLWAVYGDYDALYNPYPLEYFGYSKLTGTQWTYTSQDDIQQALGKRVASMVSITVNPNNINDVYISSYFSGLLRVQNDVPAILYDSSIPGVESPPGPPDVRVNGTAFDQAGNLWVTNSRTELPLKVLQASGQWKKYDIPLFQNIEQAIIGKLTIDKNNTKWMSTRDFGVIGFNENGNVTKSMQTGADLGNLPTNDVSVTAIDNRNQLWIGTKKGLRILSSVDSFTSGQQLASEAIIIIEDNLPQELLYEQTINDIVVDGSNNKWIGTADSGIFYVSPNGQQTIYHFTKDNSPMPSNNVNDIDINGATGEVFIATDKGMISFRGIATDAADNLNNVYVFPNPVRPEYSGTVKVSGLLDKANVKIADIEGNLVYEVVSEGGTIEWDTTAFGKYKVASGVYMIFVSAEDGGETKVKKVMIIR